MCMKFRTFIRPKALKRFHVTSTVSPFYWFFPCKFSPFFYPSELQVRIRDWIFQHAEECVKKKSFWFSWRVIVFSPCLFVLLRWSFHALCLQFGFLAVILLWFLRRFYGILYYLFLYFVFMSSSLSGSFSSSAWRHLHIYVFKFCSYPE